MSVAVIKRPHEQLQKLPQQQQQLPGPALPGLALPFVACVSFCLQSVSRGRSEGKRSEAMSGLDDDHFISFWW
jgi:hypothetical protein